MLAQKDDREAVVAKIEDNMRREQKKIGKVLQETDISDDVKEVVIGLGRGRRAMRTGGRPGLRAAENRIDALSAAMRKLTSDIPDNFLPKMRGAEQNMDVKQMFTAPIRVGDLVRRHKSVYDKAYKRHVKGNITNKKDYFSQFSEELYRVARIVETKWEEHAFGRKVVVDRPQDTGKNAARFGYFLVPHREEGGGELEGGELEGGAAKEDALGPYARGEVLLVPRGTLQMMGIEVKYPGAPAAEEVAEAEGDEVEPEVRAQQAKEMLDGVAEKVTDVRQLEALRKHVENFESLHRRTIMPALESLEKIAAIVPGGRMAEMRKFYEEAQSEAAQSSKWADVLQDTIVEITPGRETRLDSTVYGTVDEMYFKGGAIYINGKALPEIGEAKAVHGAKAAVQRAWFHTMLDKNKTYTYTYTQESNEYVFHFRPTGISLRGKTATLRYNYVGSEGEGSFSVDFHGIPPEIDFGSSANQRHRNGTDGSTYMLNSIAVVPEDKKNQLLDKQHSGKGIPKNEADRILNGGGGGGVPRRAGLAHRVAAQRRSLAALRHFYHDSPSSREGADEEPPEAAMSRRSAATSAL